MFKVDVVKYTVILMTAVSAVCYAGSEQSVDMKTIDLRQATQETVKRNPFEIMRAASEPKQESAAVRPVTVSRAVEVSPELFVEAVMLKFLKAENIMSVVKPLVQPHGSVSFDKETNTLMASGTREQVNKVLAEVRKADQTPKQIMVDVVILDVVLDNDTEMGVDWALTELNGTKQTYTHALTSLTRGATYGFIQDGINVSVKALQEKKDVEILSSPRIMVLSGQTATIKTAEEIPYEESSDTSQGGTLTSTKFKDAGITLEVSPIITDEGKIILNVKPSQSVKTGESSDNGVPVVDKREVNTTLIMNDGQVAVIGGLRRKQETLTSNKVPFFSDIPIVGGLFQSDKAEVTNSELLIMICPHVFNGRERLTNFEAQKFNELKARPNLKFKMRQPRMLEDLQGMTRMVGQ